MTEWREANVRGVLTVRPRSLPPGLFVAFSGRGAAAPGEPFPTAHLAARLAAALGLDGTPIVRATQVHGNRTVTLRQVPPAGTVSDAGECDALATDREGLALVVQTADCVPILLATRQTVGAVHAGWRGAAGDAAGAGVRALTDLGARPEEIRAWLGPSIGLCCYEVGGEVASRFAGDFVRRDCAGRHRLDLRGVNRAQLETAGILPNHISIHPACTFCGGEQYASYRRDGAAAGRMIGLVARL